MAKKRLTNKQKCFVEEYLIDLNATQAAIRAGYSSKTAKDIGAENLAKPHIAEAVKKAMDARSERTQITADDVLKELVKVAFADMGDYADWGPDGVTLTDKKDLPKGASAAVLVVKERRTITTVKEATTEHVTTEFRLGDKLRGLELIGKHLGMFIEKVELDARVDIAAILRKGKEKANAHRKRLGLKD